MVSETLRQLQQIGEEQGSFSIAEAWGDAFPWLDAYTLHWLWNATLFNGVLIRFPRLARLQLYHTTPGPAAISASLHDARERDDRLIALVGFVPEKYGITLLHEHFTVRSENGVFWTFDGRLDKVHLYQQMMADDDRSRSRGLLDGKKRKALPAEQRLEDIEIPGLDELMSMPYYALL